MSCTVVAKNALANVVAPGMGDSGGGPGRGHQGSVSKISTCAYIVLTNVLIS